MTKQEAIRQAIAAGVLSDSNIIDFDFAGNYRVSGATMGEIAFEHLVTGQTIIWILAA